MPKPRRRWYRHWTSATMIDAVRGWADTHGYPPQTHDFRTDPDLPPVATLQKLGFSVRTLREAAWLDPQARVQHRGGAAGGGVICA